jgi:hypothetical protein
MLAQKLGYHLEESFSIELRPDLPMKPNGGTCIDKIGNLHHMLPLALRISRNTAGIFEVELDLLSWLSLF